MRPPDLHHDYGTTTIDAPGGPITTGGPVRAWKLPNPEPGVGEPAWQATIRCWYLNGPFHPAWSWWQIGVVHLRDIDDVPPANLAYPEAEYELMIVSFNPEAGEPDIDKADRAERWAKEGESMYLSPPDCARHFHLDPTLDQGTRDLQAAEICDLVVKAIVNKGMSPDSDYRSAWHEVIDTTAQHYREGLHT
jgi:hypothetical protein